MTDVMQKYVELDREMPDLRSPDQRTKDHSEVYRRFTEREAKQQASRCEQCGVPFCQEYCPLHNNIPDWLKATAEGRLEDAYQLSQATNNLPEICGRICPQDRLCEAKWACTLEQSGHGTVTIGAVEKFITDTAWERGWVKPRLPKVELALRVAVVGAGPCGMAAAEELRAHGYLVDLFDRYDKVGGLMMYGIPGFKLDKEIVERRSQLLMDQGVRFLGGRTLGENLKLQSLLGDYDAVVVAIGAYAARDLGITGSDLPGVIPALDYLVDQGRFLVGEIAEPRLDTRAKRVVVVGGGDTAMDCVRTAIRQEADHVMCLYRRDRSGMPGSAREQDMAVYEGCNFSWLSAPDQIRTSNADAEFIRAEQARVSAGSSALLVDALKTQLKEDTDGQRALVLPIPGSKFTIEADIVINAIGFGISPATDWASDVVDSKIKVLKTRNYESLDVPNLYLAGDARRGPSLVVWAIREGREVAKRVHKKLSRR